MDDERTELRRLAGRTLPLLLVVVLILIVLIIANA